MEQAQQEMPQKYMAEIVRLHNKLKEGGASSIAITAETTTEVINDKLVYTDTLKFDKTVLAQATRIDPRPLEDIKTAMQAEKNRVQAQADELKAKVDEVLTAVDAKK